MTTFTSLTGAVTLLVAATWALAAPPRITGNRPALIEVPNPEAPAGKTGRAARNSAADYVAVLFPEDTDPPAEPDGSRSPAAEVKHAREQLLKVKSISAKIVENVEVLEKGFKAEGRYVQLGLREGDWKMRLELAVKIGSSQGALLEVCDGELLWMRSEINTNRKKDKAEAARKDPRDTTITRCNVTKVLNAARKLPEKSYESGLITSFGLGGLPALLASLEQSMKFTSVKETTLRDQPLVVVEGTWTDAVAQKLRSAPQQGQPASSLLPATAPDSVRLYFDRTTGFPHRIMYLKKIPGREVQKPMLTLDFLDVEINQPVSGTEFEFVPPKDVAPIERTQSFLDQLSSIGSPGQVGGQPIK